MIDRLSRPAVKALLVVGVLATPCIASAQAAAPTLNLKITPAHPYVDDSLRVAFTDTRSLPANSQIDVMLIGTGVCDSVADKMIKGPKSAGHRFSLRFRPTDQIVGSGIEWCHGKAKMRITESKNESFVRLLVQQMIRFRAKP